MPKIHLQIKFGTIYTVLDSDLPGKENSAVAIPLEVRRVLFANFIPILCLFRRLLINANLCLKLLSTKLNEDPGSTKALHSSPLMRI